ncbi:hypothetical protein [Nocardioides aurantiacus]|uniref:Lipoprotein n=1 Tax=Nocardioides aurantiacus TaxID=86796 RepID=A0A3N2CTV9_9ACTN|nr:hypothetical protein [Nocardioides aurantiacus]ROR90972.1 hypothetical protein EDD33_1829 [Nocardioides aurantiacus]
MKRLPTLIALVAIVAALAGCATLPSGDSKNNEDKGCGDCAAEVDALKTTVEQMPDVNKVGQFAYNSDTNAGSGPGLRTDIDLAKGDSEATADAVIKAAWESRITPLEQVVVVTTQGGGGAERYAATFYGNDLERYEKEWGPRPVK